jgi:hypothetical protein
MPMPFADDEPARLGVRRDRDRQLRLLPEQRGLGDRLVAQLLAGVGGIRDQLAQEYVPVGIDRVHHHVQEAGDVGFEAAMLGCDCRCHSELPIRRGRKAVRAKDGVSRLGAELC